MVSIGKYSFWTFFYGFGWKILLVFRIEFYYFNITNDCFIAIDLAIWQFPMWNFICASHYVVFTVKSLLKRQKWIYKNLKNWICSSIDNKILHYILNFHGFYLSFVYLKKIKCVFGSFLKILKGLYDIFCF